MNEKTTTIVWRATVFILVISMAQREYFEHKDRIRADKRAEIADKRAEIADKIADRVALDRRIRDYLECTGVECDNLYPDAAIVVKKARVEAAASQSSK